MYKQVCCLPIIRKSSNLDIAGHSTYCDETGGDYYDFLNVSELSENQIVLALGDVMGHGAAAAMLMATARGILRSRAEMSGTLAEMLTHMNKLLAIDTGGTRFMTMMLMILDLETGKGRWASAGHDPPVVYDSQSDEFIEMGDESGLPLGIVEEETYEEMEFENVRSGQTYLIATDGLWEAQPAEGELFGWDRMKEAVRRHASLPAEEMKVRILAELDEFMGDEKPHDDVTFIIAKVK